MWVLPVHGRTSCAHLVQHGVGLCLLPGFCLCARSVLEAVVPIPALQVRLLSFGGEVCPCFSLGSSTYTFAFLPHMPLLIFCCVCAYCSLPHLVGCGSCWYRLLPAVCMLFLAHALWCRHRRDVPVPYILPGALFFLPVVAACILPVRAFVFFLPPGIPCSLLSHSCIPCVSWLWRQAPFSYL